MLWVGSPASSPVPITMAVATPDVAAAAPRMAPATLARSIEAATRPWLYFSIRFSSRSDPPAERIAAVDSIVSATCEESLPRTLRTVRVRS